MTINAVKFHGLAILLLAIAGCSAAGKKTAAEHPNTTAGDVEIARIYYSAPVAKAAPPGYTFPPGYLFEKRDPEVKPEAKSVADPEVKPVADPEVKPEVKPVADPEVKPDNRLPGLRIRR